MSSHPTVLDRAAPMSPHDPNAWFTATVAEGRKETRDIHLFDLVRPDGRPMPAFTAGAHVEVRIGTVTRHYSLCNAPGDTGRYRIAVQREATGRGGSMRLCDTVADGDTLELRGPFNHFPLAPVTAAPQAPLLLAGGIGVTPILSMAFELAAAGRDFELHFTGRSLDRMAFLPLLRSGVFGNRVHLHADDGKGVPPMDLPALLGQGRAGRHLYVCGPAGMIDAAVATARAQGWRDDHVHFERFGAVPVAPNTGGDTAFVVKIASSGRCIPIAADQNVAQALCAAGINIPVSCEAGVCGSCRTRVLDGTPDHRDLLLTPDEQAAEFTPCCSRSLSPVLVLDL